MSDSGSLTTSIPGTFGPEAIDLAARVGDGFATVQPDAEAVQQFRAGAQRADVVAQGGMKVCVGDDEKRARRTAHGLWPNEALPGELPQVLPTPEHFEQAYGEHILPRFPD